MLKRPASEYRVTHLAHLVFALTAILLTFSSVTAQPRSEYRGFWVDTFNTTLNNHADIVAVVNNAKAAKANAVFAQVRRRGDAWYLNSLEPPPDPSFIQAGFDPLLDLIGEAHANGIEVHAFVIIGAVWNKNPTVAGGLPANANHVFNLHGGYDPVTKKIVTGPANWLTRTLLPDSTASGISFQGHRIGSDFWVDLGHPDAEAYTVDVLMRLVRNYDIDGLHLDRIRYPELSVSGQTPSTGTSTGYNDTSVARFQRRYGIAPGSPPPAQNNVAWNQWRRDQVSNLVRRVYLNAIAVKPQIKISAALIAFGGGPTTEPAWNSAEAFWRVYQDWRAWTEEGILDIAMPMDYKRENLSAQATQFDQWSEWVKNHQYDRAGMVGQGAFLNSIEGTLRQTRRALAPSNAGNSGVGVTFFSMATSNVAVTANPHSIPPAQNTPARSFAEFASGLTTGKSVNGATLYEDPAANPVPIFSEAAAIPTLSWKANPQVGHLMGFIRDEAAAIVDAGDVLIERVDDGSTLTAGRTSVMTATDGGGFYGGIDLAPGTYRVIVTPTGGSPFATQCTVPVVVGQVSSFDIIIDRDAPSGLMSADPASIWPPNNKIVTVTITGSAADGGTGISSVTFRVIDEYGLVQPTIVPINGVNAPSVGWTREIELEASRDGQDRDGRVYIVEATITDQACNVKTISARVVVTHDQGH